MATIRFTRDRDADLLPAVEQSAGEAYRSIADIAWVADGGNHDPERHRILIVKGAHWVAVDTDDRPIAFLMAEAVEDALHIWELAVHYDRQGAGIGAALIDTAIAHARRLDLPAVTLTTFTHVPWNAPWYARLGFATLTGTAINERLADILRIEIAHGLPADRRCAMRLEMPL